MTTRTTTPVRVTAYTEIGIVELRVEDCPNCGVLYGFTTDFEQRRRNDGKSWHCPNGHTISYSTTEVDRQRKRAERAEREAEYARASRDSWRDQAQAAERSRIATKGHLTRLRRRIAAGVCPCCQRTFSNVHRHIKGQHPEWAAEHAEAMQPDGRP